jgi:hypothetical protein
MGMCSGPVRAVLPDHLGRADYHGATVNSAARYMDAAAHGGQIAMEASALDGLIWNPPPPTPPAADEKLDNSLTTAGGSMTTGGPSITAAGASASGPLGPRPLSVTEPGGDLSQAADSSASGGTPVHGESARSAGRGASNAFINFFRISRPGSQTQQHHQQHLHQDPDSARAGVGQKPPGLPLAPSSRAEAVAEGIEAGGDSVQDQQLQHRCARGISSSQLEECQGAVGGGAFAFTTPDTEAGISVVQGTPSPAVPYSAWQMHQQQRHRQHHQQQRRPRSTNSWLGTSSGRSFSAGPVLLGDPLLHSSNGYPLGEGTEPGSVGMVSAAAAGGLEDTAQEAVPGMDRSSSSIQAQAAILTPRISQPQDPLAAGVVFDNPLAARSFALRAPPDPAPIPPAPSEAHLSPSPARSHAAQAQQQQEQRLEGGSGALGSPTLPLAPVIVATADGREEAVQRSPFFMTPPAAVAASGTCAEVSPPPSHTTTSPPASSYFPPTSPSRGVLKTAPGHIPAHLSRLGHSQGASGLGTPAVAARNDSMGGAAPSGSPSKGNGVGEGGRSVSPGGGATGGGPPVLLRSKPAVRIQVPDYNELLGASRDRQGSGSAFGRDGLPSTSPTDIHVFHLGTFQFKGSAGEVAGLQGPVVLAALCEH